jgi:hypothetical protein
VRDLREELQASDPVGREPDLDMHDAEAMRRAILRSLDRRRPDAASWPHPLMLAATLAVTVGASILVRNHVPRRHDSVVPQQRVVPQETVAASAGERLQLQFSTPGGTRIIWVFDPEFHP